MTQLLSHSPERATSCLTTPIPTVLGGRWLFREVLVIILKLANLGLYSTSSNSAPAITC